MNNYTLEEERLLQAARLMEKGKFIEGLRLLKNVQPSQLDKPVVEFLIDSLLKIILKKEKEK